MVISGVLVTAFLLSSCAQSELEKCKADTDKLWKTSSLENAKGGNKAYWQALKKCKAEFK